MCGRHEGRQVEAMCLPTNNHEVIAVDPTTGTRRTTTTRDSSGCKQTYKRVACRGGTARPAEEAQPVPGGRQETAAAVGTQWELSEAPTHAGPRAGVQRAHSRSQVARTAMARAFAREAAVDEARVGRWLAAHQQLASCSSGLSAAERLEALRVRVRAKEEAAGK